MKDNFHSPISSKLLANDANVGMVEYIIYLASVAGVFRLRKLSPPESIETTRVTYRAPALSPIVFCCISTLIIIRSSLAHPVLAGVIAVLFGAGTAFYKSGWRSMLAMTLDQTQNN